MSGKAFIDHFSGREDPRQAWKVVYPLPEILLGVICATLGRAEDCVEIARWGQRKRDFLSRLLPFDPGIASHDTLNDVMNALPASLCFTSWVESLRACAPDSVASDGKTSRRSRAKGSAASGLGLGEPPRFRRRLQSEYGWSLWNETTERTATCLRPASGLSGWCWRMKEAMRIARPRSGRLRRRSDAVARACVAG
jgi:hypothetical protein